MKMTMEDGRAGDLESSVTATATANANAISLVSPSLFFNNCLLPRVLFAICFSFSSVILLLAYVGDNGPPIGYISMLYSKDDILV